MKQAFFSLILFVLVTFWIFHTKYIEIGIVSRFIARKLVNLIKYEEKENIKYILQWTSTKTVPFVNMRVGRKRFLENNCSYTNCFVTSNRSYLDDITKYDVIVFAAPDLSYMYSFPQNRAPLQKYVFTSIESAHNYPVCTHNYDGYFNWSWTYRLDSESRWGYIVVRDSKHNIIGPKRDMHWLKLKDMDPVSSEFKEKLKSKTIAAAWFVSNCKTRSNREGFVRRLRHVLIRYNLEIDIYGKCGYLSCPNEKVNDCAKLIKDTYYFYLAFENALSEDYVTEKILFGLHNNAVPVVYGDANYSRFMPPKTYLNAKDLGELKLAKIMHELIQDPNKYGNYFRWKNHYSFHRKGESPETDDYCSMCRLLNDEQMLKKKTVIQNFKEWWDPPNLYGCKVGFG